MYPGNSESITERKEKLHLELCITVFISEQNKAYILFISEQTTSLIFLY